jgi:hypothetical protein
VKTFYYMTTKSLRVSWQIPTDRMHNLKLFCVLVCKNTSFCICMNFRHHHDCFVNKKKWILCRISVLSSPTMCTEHPN